MFNELKQIKALGVRVALIQALNFVSVISTALMLWKGLSIALNTESPIVVVLSGSMEPAFQRGDLLFLAMPAQKPLHSGDITVYNVPGADIPIVHRVIEVHDESRNSSSSSSVYPLSSKTSVADQWLMTKGDNNPQDDTSLYRGLRYLRRSNIVGKVEAYMPYVGYVTIVMNDYPNLKYALLAVMGGGILLHRE